MTDLAGFFAGAQAACRAGLPPGWDAASFAAAAAGDGRVASATHPAHAGSFAACLQALRAAFPSWAPGDVAITNDVYHGSTHPTEITAAAPILHADRPVAWALVRTDIADLGGWDLGAYSPRALDIWSEGGRIVPAKAFRGGLPRREVLDMLQLNSRTPRLNLACVSALGSAALGLARALGPAASGLAALADDAEQRAGAALARVERGEGKAAFDAPGGERFSIQVRITPNGSRLALSFPGLPAAAQAPLNATRAITLDAVAAAIAATLRIEAQAATALHRLIDLELADDRLLSAVRRRPAGWARAMTGRAVFRAACDALGASGDSGWPERDPHLDPASGRLAEARRRQVEALERGM